MQTKDRKLAFHELGRGKLGIEVQAAFEDASQYSAAGNLGATVTLKIRIKPSDEDPEYRSTEYSIDTAFDSVKQKRSVTTQHRDGIIIADGRDVADILQIPLDLDSGETIPFNKSKSAANG